MNYFISDTHFGHENIIRYCKRPFKDMKSMHKVIIHNWNQRVNKEDKVFFLGDFCMKKSSEAPKGKTFEYYRNQLNGEIIFLLGNHDKNNGNKSIIESMVIRYGGQRMYMTHNPKFVKEEFPICLCGHVHEKWKFKRLNSKSIIINLSVEQWGYRPVTINEILSQLHQWKRSKK